jgi:hypothetical protein
MLSGIFFSALIALLIYDININLPFKLLFFLQLTLFLSLTYGIFITLVCIAVFYLFSFFSAKKLNVAFISPFFLTVSFSILTLLYLIIYKINYDYFLSFFNTATRDLLKSQSWFLIFLIFIGFLVLYGINIYKKKFLFFTAYFLIFSLLIVFSVQKRAEFLLPERSEKIATLEGKNLDKKIIIIGLEGVSFDFLIPLMNEDKLPNFSWLIDEGCWGKLKSFSPNDPLILNSSFNTGKWPAIHRQFSNYRYQLLTFDQEIEVVPRYIFFRQLTRIGLLLSRPASKVAFTKDIWTIFRENETSYIKRDWPYQMKIENPKPNAKTLFDRFFKDLKFETEDIFGVVKTSFFTDCEYEEQFREEKKKSQPEIEYLLLNGLNIVERYFYKYSFPSLFGNIDQEEITKFGPVIERYYQFYDLIIGRYLGSLKENELLVLYSPHGIEPLPLWKRFVEVLLGNSDINAYHDMAPDGIIFFYGKEIAQGKNIDGIKLIDIAPTLLYYLGLHVGLDMDGVAQTYIFLDKFRDENPVPYITSYDEHTIK